MMRKITSYFIILIVIAITVSACSQAQSHSSDPFVFVEGGQFVNTTSQFYGENVTIDSFYIGRHLITQKEWVEVMGTNPSEFKGDSLPVEMVSWYDAIIYCNERSVKEGLKPYYTIDKLLIDPHNKSEYDDVKWTVTINEGANGYRLPTEAEWEYAASGGQLSKSYVYSGSNDANEVAWYWQNAGDKKLTGDWNWPAIQHNNNQTKRVGLKKGNELSLFDMSGNVREWCWDWFEDETIPSGVYRVVKGGGWLADVSTAEIAYSGKFEANGFGPDQGFRVIRGEPL